MGALTMLIFMRVFYLVFAATIVKGFMLAKDAVGRFQAEQSFSSDVVDVFCEAWKKNAKQETLLPHLELEHFSKLAGKPNAVTVAELACCHNSNGEEIGGHAAESIVQKYAGKLREQNELSLVEVEPQFLMPSSSHYIEVDDTSASMGRGHCP